MTDAARISVIIPANNEADYIGPCLTALFASAPPPGQVEVIVVANACTDATVARAEAFAAAALGHGWRFVVMDLAEGGKLNALNMGDAAALGDIRIYLDADVVVARELLAQIATALGGAVTGAAYASGRPQVARAKSPITRAYARFWMGLPFAQSVAPGFGLFAVNAAGRGRWSDFPDTISDDTYVRLLFRPEERIGVPALYEWPMAEGFSRLVRVRRRQDAGVAEIARRFPSLMVNEHKQRLSPGRLVAMALGDPVGFAVYAAVSLAVRFRRGGGAWVRGR